MPRPTEIAADARALYGPVAGRPAAADMGDGALWIDPGAGHALYQVQSGNWVRIGTGTAAPAAPAGVPVLYGPYVVDVRDIPHDGDKKTLWTPQVGDVLLRLFNERASSQYWDHGQLFVGQNVDGTVTPPLNTFTEAVQFPGAGHYPDAFWAVLDPAIDGQGYDNLGHLIQSTAIVFHTSDPVQIQLAQTGGTDPTQGHVELYALVARAVAP